ncbi:CoA-acylating methylmalonate-semialdehyde dehydrogenase [Rhodohalobacter sulfatireducens]|uniref:methylmalonate-semialdehyde dehydrogenase (CoA acylating) n=1 Tax=Rhodohalobacter sulfatireducens TaxID=2911366 RepID=A0ABS9KJH8_9BACT|nr:CoA-acylating methylmalonate-semialdehyde dehydrogenase [Rhodohalobacter sulfatireducens]MCG2590947.1 CoA-acylating methylmalonate-semialdehyde dehydrogenase [Rhodohalobacter sulfatireducens]
MSQNSIELRNYTNGNWTDSKSGEWLDVINPATTQKISNVPLSSADVVNKIVHNASAAFKDWRETPVTERIQYLFKLKNLLEENIENIARTITMESGKTIHESRGELRRAIENVEVACGAPTLLQGYNNEDIANGIDEMMIRQPIGVAAIICPFNFPAMIPFWFMPYAIAAGNSCIVKPSERVPNTMNLIFELIDELDLPDGVINMVHGDHHVASNLIEHPDVASISFVGSTAVAKKVYEKAAQHGKRVQASGGAKNPLIILPDADPEMTTKIVSDSAFGCAGQRCLAASLAVTVGDAKEKFRDLLSDRAKSLNVGYGLNEETQMGPVISAQSRSRIEKLLADQLTGDIDVLVDGRKPKGADLEKGYFIKPTILDNLPANHPLATTEIFGPVLSLMHVDTVEDAIELVNSGAYGNMACLFTSSGASARKFRYDAEAGNIGINIGVAAPMAFFPFSGWKDSFFGDLHGQGRNAFEFFTRQKVVVERWPSHWSRKF